MIFYKKYIDDGADLWFEIDEEKVRENLSRVYSDVDLVMEELGEGHTIRTQFALYKIGAELEEREGEER